MKPVHRPRETQVIAIRHPEMLDDAPSVLYYHGPGTSDSGSARLRSLVEASGLRHLVVSHEKHAEQATAHVQLALRSLVRNGHGIFDMHGTREQRHVVDSGLDAKPEHVTAELFGWLAEKSKERLSGSPQRGTPVFHLLSCESGALRKEMAPDSPAWKEAYLMVYAGNKATDESSYDCSLETFLRYEKHCRDGGKDLDPLKMFFLTGLRRGGCITLLGGDLKAPLTWHAPKSSLDLQQESRWFDQVSGHPEDMQRLRLAAASTGDAEKALLPPLERAAVDVFHSRLERADIPNLMQMLRKRSDLAVTPDSAGYLPLFNAAENFSLKTVQVLEMYGATLSVRDTRGDSLLVHAVRAEMDDNEEEAAAELISYLLQRGASPDEPDGQGRPALHCAIKAGRADAVKLLLEHGANPHASANGISALKLAKQMKHVRMIALLTAALQSSVPQGRIQPL